VPGFTADDLLDCYRRGVFPMADARHDERLFLVDPAKRGIIPLEGFHISHRLARTIRQGRFETRFDSAFEAVIEACAAPAAGRSETWINQTIQSLCLELFKRRAAHSVETWRDGRLVGGLYGVTVGAAFFGESMFSLERDASKIALARLVERLGKKGFMLLDAQFVTDHLRSLGAVEISRGEYRRRLAVALEKKAEFGGEPLVDTKYSTAGGPARRRPRAVDAS
jgi:leucyl/phenylalanyl-tRNA--protein transferase